jgi:hypothetical protein
MSAIGVPGRTDMPFKRVDFRVWPLTGHWAWSISEADPEARPIGEVDGETHP